MNRLLPLVLSALLAAFAACSSDPPARSDSNHETQLESCADGVASDCGELLEQPEQHADCLRAGMRKCIEVD